MPKTVGVAVSNATFHFDKLYTYAVMPAQQDAVRLGSMVLVPFGRGSRARMGVVLACDAEPESSKLKYLFDVAPASACLTPELLKLVYFLKERTFCTYYEAVKAVIVWGTVQARRGCRWCDAGTAKTAHPPHGEFLPAGRGAARKAETDRQTAGGSGAAQWRPPHAGRTGRKRHQPGGAGQSLHQRRAGLYEGQPFHRPLRQHPVSK